MDYKVGDTLQIDGTIYDIVGKIQYRNLDDNCYWFEYRLKQQGFGTEKWLSYDDTYQEYSISQVIHNISTSGYHQVDKGTQEVMEIWGNVDVKVGDTATFCEYEDITEEKIISTERWEDGEEISIGYYLDADEIRLNTNQKNTHTSSTFNSVGLSKRDKIKLVAVLIIFCTFFVVKAVLNFASNAPSISQFLKNSPSYTYVTSITGQQGEKADVYQSTTNLDVTVKEILSKIDGNTENVQQNTEDGDNSVAILTKKEYCLVYLSEAEKVLIQISNRKYAYTTDATPYGANARTHRYYRRYYYSWGYFADKNSYDNYRSPYSKYTDSSLNTNQSDTYNLYSSTIRQSSVNTRTSSGGGISSGK